MTQGQPAPPPPPPPPPAAAAPSPLKQRLWMAFHGQQQQKKLVQQATAVNHHPTTTSNPSNNEKDASTNNNKNRRKGWRGRVLGSSSSSSGSSWSSAKKLASSSSPGEVSAGSTIKGTAFVEEVDGPDAETAIADTSEDNDTTEMDHVHVNAPQDVTTGTVATAETPAVDVTDPTTAACSTTLMDSYNIRGGFSGNNSVFISVPSDTEESSFSGAETRSSSSSHKNSQGLYMLPKAEFDDDDDDDNDDVYGFGLPDADDFLGGMNGLDILSAMDDLPAFDDHDDHVEEEVKLKVDGNALTDKNKAGKGTRSEGENTPGLVPLESQEEDEDYDYDASDDGGSLEMSLADKNKSTHAGLDPNLRPHEDHSTTPRSTQTSSRATTTTASSSFMVMTPLLNEDDGKPNHLLQDRPPLDPNHDVNPAEQTETMVHEASIEVQRYTDAADQDLAHGRYKEAQEHYQKILGVARDVIESFPEDFDAAHEATPSSRRNSHLGTKRWQWQTVQRYYLVIADALNNMGVAHEMVGNYDGGIKCGKEALAVYEQVARAVEEEQARRRRRRRKRQESRQEAATDAAKKTRLHQEGHANDDDSARSNHTNRTSTSTSSSEDEEDEWEDQDNAMLQAIQKNIQRTKTNLTQMSRGRASYPERSRLHELAAEYATSPHTNDTGEAVTLYRKVLSLERTTMGRSHPQVGRTLVALAAVEDVRGNPEVAQEHFNVAFFLLRSALGERHPDVAAAYVAIAAMHDRGGEHEEALRAYQAALDIQRKALGEEHVEVASTWNNVGVQHFAAARYGEALRAYQRAIEVYEGQDAKMAAQSRIAPGRRTKRYCPEVALLWNNVGEVHRARREHTEAMEAYQKALGMFRSSLPHDGHEYVITTLLNMGVVRARNGDCDGAMAAYAEALKAQRLAAVYQGGGAAMKGAIQLPGVSGRSADVAVTLKSMGVLHERRGDVTSALRCYEEALRLRRESLGHDHVDNARLLTAMGSAQDRRGDAASALAYHSEAVRIYKKHGYYARHHQTTTTAASSPSKGKDAAKLAKEKLRRAKMAVAVEAASSAPFSSPDGWQHLHRGGGAGVAPLLDATARDYAATGRHEESLSYLADALHTRRWAMGDDHVDVAKAMVRVAHAYQKRGVGSGKSSVSSQAWASACYTGGNEEAMTMYAEALRVYRLNGLEYQHPSIREVVREMHHIRENTCSSWTRQFQ